jgi:hypothetical protein
MVNGLGPGMWPDRQFRWIFIDKAFFLETSEAEWFACRKMGTSYLAAAVTVLPAPHSIPVNL